MDKQHRFEIIATTLLIAVIGGLIYTGIQWRRGIPNHAARYNLVFTDAVGLSVDHPVTRAGVRIGVVESVALKGDNAEVRIAIEPKIQLHTGAFAQIKTKSLLGEKYLEIYPGVKDSAVLSPGSTLANNINAPNLDDIFGKTQEALDLALGMPEQVKTHLKDRFVLVDKMLQHALSISEQADKNFAELAPLLKQGLLFANLELPLLTKEIKENIALLKRLTSHEDTKSAIEQGQRILSKVELGLDKLHKINEKNIREFVQREGMRVRIFPIGEAEKRINELQAIEDAAAIEN